MILAVAELADVERRPIESFDNSRCAADLVFAETPAIELLRGSVAEAAAVHILALQAVVTAHEQTGGAEKMPETARDYALTRRPFGPPTGAFQTVKQRTHGISATCPVGRPGAGQRGKGSGGGR